MEWSLKYNATYKEWQCYWTLIYDLYWSQNTNQRVNIYINEPCLTVASLKVCQFSDDVKIWLNVLSSHIFLGKHIRGVHIPENAQFKKRCQSHFWACLAQGHDDICVRWLTIWSGTLWAYSACISKMVARNTWQEYWVFSQIFNLKKKTEIFKGVFIKHSYLPCLDT